VVLCDLEGPAQALDGERDPARVLERLEHVLEQGSRGGEVAVRRAYLDGKRFARLRGRLEGVGFEAVDVGASRTSLALRMAADALELALHQGQNEFLILSSDPELGALVDRLRGLDRTVTQCGLDDAVQAAHEQAPHEQAARPPSRRARQPTLEDEAPQDEEPEDGPVDERDAIRQIAAPADQDEAGEAAGPRTRRSRGGRRARLAPEPSAAEGQRDLEPQRDTPQDRPPRQGPHPDDGPGRDGEAVPRVRVPRRAPGGDPFERLIAAVERVSSEPGEMAWGTRVFAALQEEDPQLNESSLGYPSFDAFLEEAQRRGAIELRREPRTESYVVSWVRQP
jgi:hypothetical protein